MTLLRRTANAAGRRLLAADRSIYRAFDELGCGLGHQEAVEYITGSAHIQGLPEDQRAKAVGACLAFAINGTWSDGTLVWRVEFAVVTPEALS